MTPRFVFEPLAGSWLLVGVLVATLAGGLLASMPKRDGKSGNNGVRFELAIRFLGLVLLTFLFIRPSVIRVEKEELPASVFLLCDLSESMSVRDGNGGESRYDAMRAAFENSRATMSALCEKFDVRVLGFASDVQEIPVENGVPLFPERPEGTETALADALRQTLKMTAGRRAAATALFSDGAQRTNDKDAPLPLEIALRFREQDRALDACPFGSPDAGSHVLDLAVSDLRAPERVFIGNELAVTGQLRALGAAGKTVPVSFFLENEDGEMSPVASVKLTPESNDAAIPFELTCRPSEPGVWKLRVAVPVLDGETLDTNNELSSFVEALDGGANALYVEGTRRYEQNFLRAALDDSSDVRVKYWRPPVSSLVAKNPNATEAQLVATLAKSRKTLQETFFSDGKYAAYILGDVDSAAFQPDELKALAKLVENGAGLVILAGERSLGSGGYANTPLAELMPVEMLDSERIPLDSGRDEQGFDGGWLRGEFQVEPASDAGRDGFAAALSPDARKNRELWREMPALSSLCKLGRPRPGAETILTARSDSGEVFPLLVARHYGLGRVAVLATDSTWRWRMRGKGAEHAKFWRQLVMWSAKADETLEGELAVELDQTRFTPGEKAEFTVSYSPKPGENIEGMTVQAVVTAPDGSRENVALTEEDGVWKGAAEKTRATGDYLIEAEALSETGGDRRAAMARFLVYERSLELERPGASPETMERLAATSQGKLIQPDELESYLSGLLELRDTIADYRDVKRSLYDTFPVFVAFMALMTLEWLLRKKRGLP